MIVNEHHDMVSTLTQKIHDECKLLKAIITYMQLNQYIE